MITFCVPAAAEEAIKTWEDKPITVFPYGFAIYACGHGPKPIEALRASASVVWEEYAWFYDLDERAFLGVWRTI